jgi:DNA uptake protein ComE-like DNA-binding protein
MKTAQTKPPKSVSRFTLHESASASALILAVVLTSLLAIIGVMFIMIARVDKMATSAISENKELNFAVETVVAKISQELVLDVPGMPKGSEYYDYPDANNAWLASLEPYKDGTDYKWRQISDVYEKLPDLELTAGIIPDYQEPSYVGDSNSTKDYPADADGDGVADSKWVELDDITSNKGKPIYAAIRIVDNGGMINVNTAYKFDPNSTVENDIDGSSQMQINLLALSKRGSTSNPLGKLDDARFGSEPHNLNDYIKDVVWRYNEPNGAYTPFDIGDELKLRNRYILNYNLMVSRIEDLWENVYDVGPRTPIPTSAYPFSRWPNCTILGTVEPNDYDYRHISTTYNMDRIIDPNGAKMTNVNTADVNALYNSICKGLLDTNYPDVNGLAAQMAVNIKDFVDNDVNVTVLPVGAKTYYGFEVQPFISEIAAIIDTIDPNNKSFYALELYNPFNISVSLSDFVLSISNGSNISLSGTIDPNGYFVISNDLSKFTINTTHTQTNSGLKFSGDYFDTTEPPDGIFDSWVNYSLTLKRTVGGSDIILDIQDTNNAWFAPVGNAVYAQRDTGDWHVVYQTIDPNLTGTLGSSNVVSIPRKNYNLSLANDKFVTVGDIARVLTVGPSPDPNDMIGVKLAAEPNEESVRLNLQNAAFQQIFNYLTVFDPTQDNIDNDGDGEIDETDPNKTLELKVPGRININTAPWYAIAQLSWVSQRKGGYNNTALAEAIVAYRDKLETPVNYSGPTGRGDATGINNIREELGFESIGELNFVIGGLDENYRIDYYKLVSGDLTGFPDLTPGGSAGDGAPDDFEERDVIFARISNLVTVRSDVFTAYILVRIGTDGPQKRVMAILDRSDVYPDGGKVRIIALHPVPDPR